MSRHYKIIKQGRTMTARTFLLPCLWLVETDCPAPRGYEGPILSLHRYGHAWGLSPSNAFKEADRQIGLSINEYEKWMEKEA
ncbi:hypothetical protein BISA_1373 [Bifidobacterium saguini DSM 23967]|uniref:Uncharacterized protein n=1 Tax=Bifidobacterium saguini DSM 23967 TaxID=1437607 RepID=A0A087DCF7_9BIFI|nr:hypothetical protein [Bifidobacterium saguini]KFI93207.1 hypothetical protein BISA_1373 [Bifidobacterium saguini DSM 23967]